MEFLLAVECLGVGSTNMNMEQLKTLTERGAACRTRVELLLSLQALPTDARPQPVTWKRMVAERTGSLKVLVKTRCVTDKLLKAPTEIAEVFMNQQRCHIRQGLGPDGR